MSLTNENCKRAHVSQTGAALTFWSAFFAPERQLGTRQLNGLIQLGLHLIHQRDDPRPYSSLNFSKHDRQLKWISTKRPFCHHRSSEVHVRTVAACLWRIAPHPWRTCLADLSNDQIIHQQNDIQMFDAQKLLYLMISWGNWLQTFWQSCFGRKSLKGIINSPSCSQMMESGSIKLCLSCRTCGDRDDANYTHPHSPCMSRTIRVNVVSSTNGSTSRSRSGGVSVMEIDINLTSAGKVIKVSRLQHDQPLYLVLYPTASLNLLGYEKFMAGVFF